MDINGNNIPATTTLAVAEFTGKEHRNVIRDLESLVLEGYVGQLSFLLTLYRDKSNKET